MTERGVNVDDWLQELDGIINLIKSPGWNGFVKVLKKHKQFLQGQVNLAVDKGDIMAATKSRAKMEDVDKILSLFQDRFNELNKQKEEQDGG